MRKYFLFFAYIFSVVSLTLLFAIFYSFFWTNFGYAKVAERVKEKGQKIYYCNVYFETQEFVVFIQEKSQENPEKFASKKNDFKKLAEDIEALSVKSDNQGICKKYKDFKEDY